MKSNCPVAEITTETSRRNNSFENDIFFHFEVITILAGPLFKTPVEFVPRILRAAIKMDFEKAVCRSDLRNNTQSTTTAAVNATHLLQENLEQVFDFLSVQEKGRVAQVCHAWRNAVYRSSLWRDVKVKLRLDERPSEGLIASLAKRQIQHVEVLQFNADHLCAVIDGVVSLTSINFGKTAAASDSTLSDAFILQRPNFVSLGLLGNGSITDVTATLLAVNVRNLSSLSLESCDQLTDTSLLLIAKGLRNLKALRLWGCNGISDAGIGKLFCVDNQEADGLIQLHSFSLFGAKLTNVSLFHIAATQKHLTSLKLHSSNNMTDVGMRHLSVLYQLSSLTLSGDLVTDAWLRPLSTGKWKIWSLELISCGGRLTNVGIGSLALVVDLERLAIRKCVGVGNQGLISLADSKINELIVDSCPITDDSLGHLARLSNLQTLVLLDNPNLSSTGIVHLSDVDSNISSLTVSGSPKIGPAALRFLASGWFQVRYLELDRGYVNEKGLVVASRLLNGLESLLAGGEELIGRIRDLRLSNTV